MSSAAAQTPDPLDLLAERHPDMAEIARRHLRDVAVEAPLPRTTEAVVVLGALVALGARRPLRDAVASALTDGVEVAVVTEVLYQAAPYAGLARALDAAAVVDDVLADHGVDLPVASQATTTAQTRRERGLAVQGRIAGEEAVRRMYDDAPADLAHIQRSLSEHCFGDHLTRGVLDVPTRELLTLAMLVALGGADPQVASHLAANLRVGNDRAVLVAVLTRLLPWVGYPRTLNALRALADVAPPDAT